jgi:hypothetical protein
MGLFKKRLGESPVPGDGTVSLPAGKVIINYEEQRKGRTTDDDGGSKAWPGVPDGLEVTVRPAGGGEPLSIDRPRGIHEYANLRTIGSRYGHIEVVAAGDYTFTVAPFTADRELFEPHLMFKG